MWESGCDSDKLLMGVAASGHSDWHDFLVTVAGIDQVVIEPEPEVSLGYISSEYESWVLLLSLPFHSSNPSVPKPLYNALPLVSNSVTGHFQFM